MKSRMPCSLAACLLVLGMNASPASAAFPGHEVWIGFGGAASGEKNIFNTPTDLESSPDVVTNIMYTKNFDATKALGLHFYGGTETTDWKPDRCAREGVNDPSSTLIEWADLNKQAREQAQNGSNCAY